jgi:uncharacterized protein
MLTVVPSQANCQTLRLAGADLLAAASGALLWPKERTLVVADLHLEKGSSYATRGVMLPPYDTRATLDRLERVLSEHDTRRVICLGDSFHDATAPARLTGEDERRLARLTAAVEWYWIAGNHDPAPPAALGGRVITGALRLGPFTFRHIADDATMPGEISGHFHPKASLALRGRRLSGRCFVFDERRLVMPAFGAYAGGLDVLDPALGALFPDGFTVHLLARERVTTLPRARLA